MEGCNEETEIIIRAGRESDSEVIMTQIKDLAVYEGMPEQVKITSEDLRRDAFHTNPPVVYTLVAELSHSSNETDSATASSDNKNKIIGYALYYYSYSTWKGKAIHLEDLYVQPEYRHKGVGGKILKHLANLAHGGNYARISFECIDWNESAIKFYTKYGAKDITLEDKWHSYRFTNETLQKLASNL